MMNCRSLRPLQFNRLSEIHHYLKAHVGESADDVALLVLRLLFFRIAQRLELLEFRIGFGLAPQSRVGATELIMPGGKPRLGSDDLLKLGRGLREAVVAHVD